MAQDNEKRKLPNFGPGIGGNNNNNRKGPKGPSMYFIY